MHVSVETTSELGRKLKIEVPSQRVEDEVADRIRKMAPQVRVDGFRPGKVPLGVVRKLYAGRVREEVLQETIESSLRDALQQEKLEPAATPRITDFHAHAGEPLRYEVSFEVYPKVQLSPPEQIPLTRFEAELGDADVDQMMERLRRQRRRFEAVERPAMTGDRLLIDLDTSVAGAAVEGAQMRHALLELGANGLPPGFDAQLAGAITGERREFDLQVPDDYPSPELAGKTAHFAVHVKEIQEPVLPGLDADLARSFGVESGDLDQLRREVRENMERELNATLHNRNKDAVMEALLRHNEITLPESLVQEEMQRLAEPHRERAKQQGQVLDEEKLAAAIEPAARRRVALGLIIRTLVAEHGLRPDRLRVRRLIEQVAGGYAQPELVVQWYYERPERVQEFELMDMENQVVEWFTARAQVTVERRSFAELMFPAQHGGRAQEHSSDNPIAR